MRLADMSEEELKIFLENIHLFSSEEIDALMGGEEKSGSTITGIPYSILPYCQADPIFYAKTILKIDYLTPEQITIAREGILPPGKTEVDSGHAIGKTWLAALLVNWRFDCFIPSSTYCVAPTKDHVQKVLFKEIRLMRQRAGRPNFFIGPVAPEMSTSPNHFAMGLTSSTGEGFQGRHDGLLMFIFDEAVGIDQIYFETLLTMLKPDLGHLCFAFCNPTDTTSAMYSQYLGGGWRRYSMSSLNHPNVAAELSGKPRPVPSAVSVHQIDGWIRDWCRPVSDEERNPTDLQWKGKWYRPGPLMQARALGKWPTGFFGVWSDFVFSQCCNPDRQNEPLPMHRVPEIGIDVARQGDDFTAIHIRWGKVSLNHFTYQGLRTNEIVGITKNFVDDLVKFVNSLRGQANTKNQQKQLPEINFGQIPIKVDDDGVGGGVTDFLMQDGFNVVPVNSATIPFAQDHYPNKRSELWFQISLAAEEGLVNFSRLPKEAQDKLRIQFMAVKYAVDSRGKRMVDPKKKTKEEIGRSPDDADACNLAYYHCDIDLMHGEVLEVVKSRPEAKERDYKEASNPFFIPEQPRNQGGGRWGMFGRK